MTDYIKEYVQSKSSTKRIGIFGTGVMADIAENFLRELGIKAYVFFDNDVKKQEIGTMNKMPILSPTEINKGDFVLISTVYFDEIKKQLDSMGLKEWDNYIWALEMDYYDKALCYKNAPRVPEISFGDFNDIECELSGYVDVERIDWFDEREFSAYENDIGFQKIYDKRNNKRYRRKIMEYFIVDKLLNFDDWDGDSAYVDIGAAGSPFAKYLREKKGIKAYALDLNKGIYDDLPYYIQGDATNMPWADNEISGISMQSAFEMFVGNADEDFIREAARVLKQGGKVIICPLYMHKQYLSTVSPNYYHMGTADEGSLECIRNDCRGYIPLGRFYNAKAFERRVLKNARRCGLKPKIYSLPQELVEKDGFVYLKFILQLEKTQ